MKRGPGRPRKPPAPSPVIPRDPEDQGPIDPREEFANWDEDERHPAIRGKSMVESALEEEDVQPPASVNQLPSDFLNKLHIDSRVTTLKIVAILWNVCRLRLEERKVGQILSHAGLFLERNKGFELLPAFCALIEYYKRQAERTGKAGDADKDRIKKANADTAEMNALLLAKELCPMAAAKQFWSDARIELRKEIESAGYLTKDQKAKLLESFQGLKTRLFTGETE